MTEYDYGLDLAGTSFSTDDGIHDGLTRKPYRREEPTEEQILMERYEITPEQARRILDIADDWDRERRWSRREYD